jgi:hypothetical protein
MESTPRDNFNSPIFILGLPRSGTSMIAGALEICGAWAGSTVPGEPENPKGYFEHIVLRERLTKRILALIGCDPLGVTKLPPVDLHGEIEGLHDLVRTAIENDGYAHDRRWLYKDIKLSLIWPFFNKAFPDATWLIVRRDEESVINSCLNAYFFKPYSQDREFWKQYAHEYQIRLEALKRSGVDVLEISTPAIINGNFSELESLISRLGLTYRENELKEFICPDYWHGDAEKG